MHELISTWEQFLFERYGKEVTSTGNDLIEHAASASVSINKPLPHLLREYGRHTTIHSLYPHLQPTCTQEMIIMARTAYVQLRRTTAIPPIYQHTAMAGGGMQLTYDGHEQLCSIIWGILEGCALIFRENIAIAERSCIQHGGDQCLFEVHFLPPNHKKPHKHHQKIVDLLLATLSENEQCTLGEASVRLRRYLKYTIDFGLLKNIITQYALIVSSTNENQEWRVGKITSSIGDALVVRV
jgi:hypothetical protein